ncbi:hypothetical protein B2G71_18230 [Novosphingobium sp. PC22D]|uniref:copper chaperone PCu(A)C n=1 Tax=Novosphingobium sp. PC22D TaxID=1962403 RepID=UPI000BEF6AC2|nr:copper chaperone PCu(A)C [Novosphingobium sp. PC22D]PEQ11226.1 hypothetical protein B2G71_18230 [Novosphingobium sp. PC22D]
MIRSGTGSALILAAALAALGACQEAKSPEPAESGAFTAEPDAKPGLSASEGRLVLPAVPGRPGVVYFSLHNGSGKPTSIAAIHIDGVGKTEMHRTEGGQMASVETVPVAAGGDVTFAPGGLHVMAFDIGEALAAGGTTEMTITFEGGDKLSVPVPIEAMGSGMSGGMAGMDHEGEH